VTLLPGKSGGEFGVVLGEVAPGGRLTFQDRGKRAGDGGTIGSGIASASAV
jgi:hypothetical protein